MKSHDDTELTGKPLEKASSDFDHKLQSQSNKDIKEGLQRELE